MIAIPAIDLSEGQCVRLKQGDIQEKTVFPDDPADTARRWADQGAEVLHVVDLDGAMSGSSADLEAVSRIVEAIPIPVELGGELETRDAVATVLDLGVQWAIMGTSALANRPELEACLAEFGHRIIVGIDARDGKVAVSGWTETSNVTALALAAEMEKLSVARIIFTDIATDGMLQYSLRSLEALADVTSVPLIASGGVTTLNDVRALKLLEPKGVIGCIIGRALYSGTISLNEAIRVAAE